MERVECRDCGRVELHDDATLDRSGWWQAPPPDGAPPGDYGALCPLCAVMRIRGEAGTPTFHALGFVPVVSTADTVYLGRTVGGLWVRVAAPSRAGAGGPWVVTTFPAGDSGRPLSSSAFGSKGDALRHTASILARELLT